MPPQNRTGQTPTVDPCCIRCAQLYKDYPDLVCNPERLIPSRARDRDRTKVNACKNCQTSGLRCYRVPEQHHEALSALQAAARAVESERKMGRIPVEGFYRLRDAQEVFTLLCGPANGLADLARDRPNQDDSSSEVL